MVKDRIILSIEHTLLTCFVNTKKELLLDAETQTYNFRLLRNNRKKQEFIKHFMVEWAAYERRIERYMDLMEKDKKGKFRKMTARLRERLTEVLNDQGENFYLTHFAELAGELSLEFVDY
jgi:hypothetical protein